MRTVLPLMTADVISPVMTCDFPVPGGPWTTISSPRSMAVRMFSWELFRELMYTRSFSEALSPLSCSSFSVSGAGDSERKSVLFRSTIRSLRIPLISRPASIPSKSFWMELEYVGYFPIMTLGTISMSPARYLGNSPALYSVNGTGRL